MMGGMEGEATVALRLLDFGVVGISGTANSGLMVPVTRDSSSVIGFCCVGLLVLPTEARLLRFLVATDSFFASSVAITLIDSATGAARTLLAEMRPDRRRDMLRCLCVEVEIAGNVVFILSAYLD